MLELFFPVSYVIEKPYNRLISLIFAKASDSERVKMSRLLFAFSLAFLLSYFFATVSSADGGSCSVSPCKCRDGEKKK